MEPGYSYGLIATMAGVACGAYFGFKRTVITSGGSEDKNKNGNAATEDEATLTRIKNVLRGAWYGGAIFGLVAFFFVYLIQKYT